MRGLVFTDAKIGVFTHPQDETLLQNRCFLYHLIGNKTGEWKVPVGGMGSVARELERVARQNGAEMFTRVNLRALDVTGKREKTSSLSWTENAGDRGAVSSCKLWLERPGEVTGQTVSAGCDG